MVIEVGEAIMRMRQTFKTGLSSGVALAVIALVWAVRVGTADEEAIKPQAGEESRGARVVQSDVATKNVIELMHDSIFRIDRQDEQGKWNHHGTGFAIELPEEDQRLFVATNAHVVEKDADLYKPTELSAVVSGNGPRYLVSKILPHPIRQNPIGPDVAILELQPKGRGATRPKGFRLLPKSWNQKLAGTPVVLMGFPGNRVIDNQTPFVTRGDINQEQKDWLLYSLFTQGGASGSPVFLVQVEPDNENWFAQEYVTAVHSRRTEEAFKMGVPVKWLWQLLDQHKIPAVDVFRAPRPILRPVVPIANPGPAAGNGGFVVIQPRQKRTPEEEREAVWESATALVEQGKAVEAHHAIEKLRLWFKNAKTNVPWEVDCLCGVNWFRNAELLWRNNQIDLAQNEHQKAMAEYKSAVDKLPASRFPMLLRARAANRVATIRSDIGIDVAVLKQTHDQAEGLLKTMPLSQREKAQALYVLAYTHRYLDCGKDNDGKRKKSHDEFLQSFRFLPSRQSADWHMRMHDPTKTPQVDPKLPDLWDEVTTLKSAWNNRYLNRTP